MRTVAVVEYRRTVRAVRQVENPTTSTSTTTKAHHRCRRAAMRLRSGSARSTGAPVPSCRCSIIDSPTPASPILDDSYHADDAQDGRQQVHAERQILPGQSAFPVEEDHVIRKQHHPARGAPAQRTLKIHFVRPP